ncbi:NAD-binding protein [Vulcanisaeta distributa]|uniref:potassium channel family protein n=1 Tax=Vulcanisaeta distributa TaxID=164451 RepID=UPI001FB2981A|nr:NAD-binding protein [Vulcanisaeta distributa]
MNEISVVVARLLVGNGYDVSMIAGNENEAKLGRGGVPAYVHVGNPRDESILRDAGIDESEVVVLSMDDESNLEVARIAKSRGVPTIIALVSNKERYLDSFIELGIYAIPIVDAILSKIAHYLRLPFKQLLYSDDKVQAYYVVISSESPYINQEVRDVARKCGVAIPLIIRGGEDVIISDEELRIEAGDKLLIVGASDSVVKCVEKIY